MLALRTLVAIQISVHQRSARPLRLANIPEDNRVQSTSVIAHHGQRFESPVLRAKLCSPIVMVDVSDSGKWRGEYTLGTRCLAAFERELINFVILVDIGECVLKEEDSNE